jgi:serine/threonine-protein kinase
VIHRDIKPENVLLQDGQALVADFGIALALSQAGGARLTETGLSLGTPHYMSPEQATGDRALDGRADIYSLGAVVYEMLTGDPPHTGSTVQGIIAKVLSATPLPVSNVRPAVPAPVDAAVQRALARTPADRFATAAEFSAALTVETLGAGERSDGSAFRGARYWRSAALVLGAVVLTGAARAAWSAFRAPPAHPTYVELSLPDNRPLVIGPYTAFALSPDGSALVYAGVADGRQLLLVRRLDRLAADPLPGTEGGGQPFFSPDGQWVGFFAGGRLKKVALAGGTPITLAEASNPRGGTWTSDGRIVYQGRATGGLLSIPESGGEVDSLTIIDSTQRAMGITNHRWPSALPDGRGVAFGVFNGVFAEMRLAVVTPDKKVKNLAVIGTQPQVTPAGQLLWVNPEGALVAASFDARRLELTGAPVTVVGDVACDATTQAAFYSITNNGNLAYLQGSLVRPLVRVDRNGAERVLLDSLFAPTGLRFSPDGNRVAMETQAGRRLRIWVYDLQRGTNTPLTFEGQARYPAWHPTQDRVLFSLLAPGLPGRRLYEVQADGAGAPSVVLGGAAPYGDFFEGAWLPDARHLVVRTTSMTGQRDIWVAAAGRDSLRALSRTEFDERAVAVSPNGRWVAYLSDESGQGEVYVRPADGGAGKWQISRDGGSEPVWSHDGRELFYRGAQSMIAVSVATSPSFVAREGRPLFRDVSYSRSPDHSTYDVHPSGGWFVMTRNGSVQPHVILVQNFGAGLAGTLRR